MRVLDVANHVQRRLIPVAALLEWNLRPRHQQRHRHRVAPPCIAKEKRLQIYRKIRFRQVARERCFKVALALLAGRVPVVRGRVVTGPVAQTHIRAVHANLELAVLSIARRVGRAEAQHVVARRVVLHLRKRGREVVVVEKRLAARVRRKCSEHFLRVVVRVEVILQRAAGVRGIPAQRAGARVAERRNRLQAARVHAVDRQVIPHRVVDGRPHRGLVFDPIPLHAARKIQEGFLLVQRPQCLGDRADREQLAVGVDVVVLALVRGKRRRILHLVGRAGRPLRVALAPAARVARDRAQQQLFVRGKVLVERQRITERNYADQVGILHAPVDVIPRRVLRARQVIRCERGRVEKQHNQTVIAQRPGLLQRARSQGCSRRPTGAPGHSFSRGQAQSAVYVLRVKARHTLRFAVLQNREIVARQPAHRRARLAVAHHHIRQHQIALHAQRKAARG